MNSFDLLILTELEDFENNLDVALAADVQLVDDIARYMSKLKGKRLRPALALLSAKAVGLECKDDIIDAAVAVEMIHAATMVHDDVVDSATMRRGCESINEKWSGQVAVLMGDFLLAKALSMLVEIGNLQALAIVSKATQRLSIGEIFEIQIGEQHDVRESSYLSMVNDKTASLISASVCLGPIFSKADQLVIDSMKKYGELLGAAFQIADDILDFTGDSATMGKPVGHDLREGKLTLPLIRALQRAPLVNRDRIRCLLRKSEKDEMEWQQIVTFVEEFSGVAAAEVTAREYSAQALECLQVLPETPAREALELAVELVVERKS
ncbi:MAG: polyprenyl synthetase family protein [Candidatus Latescibacterota bacterium]|nr:polyprenyl synthetase family protein [Candidatus Latescibacterota bacterium]